MVVKWQPILLHKVIKHSKSTEWRGLYPEASIHQLASTHFDHCPVLLKMDDHGPSSFSRPFRFQPKWMSHPLFPEVVADSWTVDGPQKLNVEKFTTDVKI